MERHFFFIYQFINIFLIILDIENNEIMKIIYFYDSSLINYILVLQIFGNEYQISVHT